MLAGLDFCCGPAELVEVDLHFEFGEVETVADRLSNRSLQVVVVRRVLVSAGSPLLRRPREPPIGARTGDAGWEVEEFAEAWHTRGGGVEVAAIDARLSGELRYGVT